MIAGLILGLIGLAYAACPATEKEALENLYDSLDGANWKSNNWLTADVSHCSWTGITCDSNDNVIGIDLSDMGLTGALPADIGCFPLLRSLYLNNNDLAGAIPTELCSLTSIQYLQINSAGLTGEIPECMCDLVHIMFWYMSSNSLSGSIPTCVSELQFLKELHLDCNELTGDVPAEIFNLAYLMELHAQCNANLVCTAAPATFQGIYLCGMDDCDYCGALPPTNCPDTLQRDGCTYYRQNKLRKASGKSVNCNSRSSSSCTRARSNKHNSAYSAQKKCNMPNSRSQTPLKAVVKPASRKASPSSLATGAKKMAPTKIAKNTNTRPSASRSASRSATPQAPKAAPVKRAPAKAPSAANRKPIVRRR